MLPVPANPGPEIRPVRHWKTASAAEAAALIGPAATVGVGWLGDGLATALADRFLARAPAFDLTVVYAETRGEGRNHGLNLLAHEGLVRRVIGGQWHPVPGLQALATANRIEAYSLPVGIIKRLFHDNRRRPAGPPKPRWSWYLHGSAQRRRPAEPADPGTTGEPGISGQR